MATRSCPPGNQHYFDSGNRLSQDTCALAVKDIGNSSIVDYYTTNLGLNCQQQEQARCLANEYPSMLFNFGYGVDCKVIDNESELKLSQQLRGPENQQLCTRLFTAVPDVGRAGLIPDTESMLKNGIDTTALKDCHKTAEVSWRAPYDLNACTQDYIGRAAHVPDAPIIGVPSKDIYLAQRKAQLCKR